MKFNPRCVARRPAGRRSGMAGVLAMLYLVLFSN